MIISFLGKGALRSLAKNGAKRIVEKLLPREVSERHVRTTSAYRINDDGTHALVSSSTTTERTSEMTITRYILARLKEPSTWAGITGFATVVGVTVSPEQAEAIATAGAAVAAAILTILRDTGSTE